MSDMEAETLEMEAFLEYFSSNHRDDNFSTIKYGLYDIKKLDLEGEILDWTLQYLQYMSCPASLEAGLAKAVLDETKLSYLNEDTPDGKTVPGKKAFTSLSLLQNVTVTVNEVCRRLKKEESYRKSFLRSKNLYPCSVCAIRNGRKKMEDRHILIHDMNAIFKRNSPSITDEDVNNGGVNADRASFYGVYDGHVGKDAAAFCAAHLHQFLLQSEHYPSDPVKATFEAYQRTNLGYEQNMAQSCGTTVVFTLILGRKMYISWLGDSQVLLVRNGHYVKVVTPHKPDRKDERDRISNAGGTVLYYGQWRVNGLLAVSRSIGDFEHRAFISAEPDVTSIEMNDSEDFVILGSDGLWDHLSHEKVTAAIFEHLAQHAKANGEIEKLSSVLANLAKENGSGDNISVIVVFLKPVAQLIEEHLSRSSTEVSRTEQYSGISSTCKYITQMMSEDTLLAPSSSVVGKEVGAFSSPGGGGMTFGGNFSPDGRINDSEESEEQFRRASDSMFPEGSDFMSNNSSGVGGGGSTSGNAFGNPFLGDMNRKPDSGFISPACNSSNKSSDEDRKEDEEFLESQEVSKLLGGTPMEGLLGRSGPDGTPTPPVDETGSSLEEILAVARDNPDSVGEIDDDDSDESSTDDSKPPEVAPTNKDTHLRPAANVSDSDEEENDDFTFVKEGGSQNLLADIQEDTAFPNGVSNGHHPLGEGEEEEGVGPSSVIIESQEAPNPDSASFILKTSNSEAPELPSPQEPVVEMIMEEGVGNASSPILEEAEEDYPPSQPAMPSPHKEQQGGGAKETSELECDGSDALLLDPLQKKPLNNGNPTQKEEQAIQPKEATGYLLDLEEPNAAPAKEMGGACEEMPVHDEPKSSEALLDLDIESKAQPEVVVSPPSVNNNNGSQQQEVEEEAFEEVAVSKVSTESSAPHEEEEVMVESIEPKLSTAIGSVPPNDKEVVEAFDEMAEPNLPTAIEAGVPSDKEEVSEAFDQMIEPKLSTAIGSGVPSDKEEVSEVFDEMIEPKLSTAIGSGVSVEKEEVVEAFDEMIEPKLSTAIGSGVPVEKEVVVEAFEEVIEPKLSTAIGSGVSVEKEVVVEAFEEVIEPKLSTAIGSEVSVEKEVVEAVEEVIEPKLPAEMGSEKDVKIEENAKDETTAISPAEVVSKQLLDTVEKPVASQSETKTTSSSLPSSKGGSPKKASGGTSSLRKPLSSTTPRSTASSSSPKKTSAANSAAKSTPMSKRPASATKAAVGSSRTTTSKTTIPPKPSSASRVGSSLSKTAPSAGLSSSKTPSARPASSSKTSSSSTTLTRKTTTTTTTSSSRAPLRTNTRPGVESKPRVEKKEPLSKPLGSTAATTKPRVGSGLRSSTTTTSAAKSNGTTSTARKPLASARTASTSSMSASTVKKTGLAAKSSVGVSRLTSSKSTTTTTTASTTKTSAAAGRKPGSNVSAKVSTGLTNRPKSSTLKTAAAPKPPSENGVNGNEAPKEEVTAAVAGSP